MHRHWFRVRRFETLGWDACNLWKAIVGQVVQVVGESQRGDHPVKSCKEEEEVLVNVQEEEEEEGEVWKH